MSQAGQISYSVEPLEKIAAALERIADDLDSIASEGINVYQKEEEEN